MALKIPNLDWLLNDPYLNRVGEALQALGQFTENLGQKTSMGPQSTTKSPSPHSQVNVSAANGIIHVSLVDNNPRTNQVHNFLEWGTQKNFSDAQTEHLGVSRQRRIASFMGDTPIYVRSYTQYPDGTRSEYAYHGTQTNPTPIQDGTPTFVTTATGGGVTTTTGKLSGPALPAPTGSGTSASPGEGFGKEAFVPNPSNPGKPPSIF